MARVFQRGKIWYIDYEYRGKRTRRSLDTRSKCLADLALKDMEVKIAREELDLSGPKKIGFADFCDRFLRWYQTQNASKSYRDYKNLFHSTILPVFGPYRLTSVTVEMVEGYKIQRSRKVKPASVNKELTALHTGLRKAELFRLEWRDVDFERGVICVTSRDEEHTKNYRNREVPMTKELARCLAQLPRRAKWVFTKSDGRRYSGWVRTTLDTIAARAGIPRFSLHDFRHSFASHAIMAGTDLTTLKELMGHADISTTMIYAHVTPDHHRRTIDRLEDHFRNGTLLAHSKK